MSWKAIIHPVRKAFVMPLMAVAFTLIIVMVAFAVDLGYITVAKAELRAAIDAANLAGASGLIISPAEARTRAKNIAASNKVGGKPLVLLDSDIELGRWDTTAKKFVLLTGSDESKATAMRITGRLAKTRNTELNLFFGPLVGKRSVDMVTAAVAGFGQAADIVLVQDVTSSFDAEIADAKTGDQALLDALYANGAGKSWMGIAVHTGWGKTMTDMRSINSDYNNLKSVISSFKLCGNSGMPVCSGTDIAAGLAEGIKIFTTSSYTGTPGVPKAIILVSDGEPTSSSNGSHPNCTDAQMLAFAKDQADAAWAKGIHVYIVMFNRENSTSAAANVKSLVRGTGDFVQVTNPKDLPKALEEITKRLPMGLLQ